MTAATDTVLIIGYGNPGRRDDGLGPAAAAALEQLNLPGVTVDSDYQLTVEDAADAARHDVVLFIDADTAGPGPYYLRPIAPGDTITFSTHSIQPDVVLALAIEAFGRAPAAYVLGIRGFEFNEFGEGLSAAAAENLQAALRFIEPIIHQRNFAAVAETNAPASAPACGDK